MIHIHGKWREKEIEDGYRWTRTEGATTQRMLHRIYRKANVQKKEKNLVQYNAYKSDKWVMKVSRRERERGRGQEGRVVLNVLVSSYSQQNSQKHTVTCKLSPHSSPENIVILRPLQSRVARHKHQPSHTLKCIFTLAVHTCVTVHRRFSLIFHIFH